MTPEFYHISPCEFFFLLVKGGSLLDHAKSLVKKIENYALTPIKIASDKSRLIYMKLT